MLADHRYMAVQTLLAAKQAALQALDVSKTIADELDTDEDKDLARTLYRLAEQNKDALGRALRVQDRIMGIMADAARQMMETPHYGGGGQRAMQRSGIAVALIKQA
ncbi:hypothetical protein NFI95_14570 [Acetobacteraceae bacterium KSS8]|uniref:Flagellar protein FlgN n=1 Tax=Endosaccharibacter trunci TaxID=2812733 RepID=A0ABT1W9V2_9PROT|nr:hypothetical protein [Acetobacteraceae bacterium KSS8]